MIHHLFTFFLAFSFFLSVHAQTMPVKENSKWGIQENGKFIVPAVYDTVFNFDSTSRVCLACFKIKKAANSKFIKSMSTTYACNYLNKKGERFIAREEYGDTLSVFSLGKNTVTNFQSNQNLFVVTAKNKKNLVDKDFKQKTFKGYHDITPSKEKEFYLTQIINEGDVIVSGLINTMEREIIPHTYSFIKINTSDSLLIACSAGIRTNGEDVIFDYNGLKTQASYRHIDLATKHFLIHKIFEPKEYYVFYNIETKSELIVYADEVKIYAHDELLIRIKKDWYLYDLNSNKKTPFKQL